MEESNSFICPTCFFDFQSSEELLLHETIDPLCSPVLATGLGFNVEELSNPRSLNYNAPNSPATTFYAWPYSLHYFQQHVFQPLEDEQDTGIIYSFLGRHKTPSTPVEFDIMTDSSMSDEDTHPIPLIKTRWKISRIFGFIQETLLLRNNVILPEILNDYPAIRFFFQTCYALILVFLVCSGIVCFYLASTDNKTSVDHYYIFAKHLTVDFIV
ncbi:hypothetical protein A0J61_08291 [Choanephora cucurbitarum]|uniref:Uncharacterized protein n=1 Tax=Choanephora cucurbitarum TaxID=101091 RepID=A0A1C7N3T0_9FUNG|nr:hypothetical protein A0J61_08291 [Choanephora cucurbitarum]